MTEPLFKIGEYVLGSPAIVWFNPDNVIHIESLVEYLETGFWPDNGTKPADINLNYKWRDSLIAQVALASIKQIINKDIARAI